MKPYEMLVKLNACPEAVAWVKKFRSAKSAWKACERGDWMLWYCGQKAGPVGDERRKLLVLAAVACARLALPIWKKRYPDDNRVEVCLDTAEKWARNEATLEALQVARRNCYAASCRRRRRLRLRLLRRRRRFAYAASAADAASSASAAADAAFAAAAYAAYASSASAASARAATLKQCADIVRKHYPKPPV